MSSLVQVAFMLAFPLFLGAAALRVFGIGWRTDAFSFPGWAWMVGGLLVASIELVRLLAGLASPWAIAWPAGLGALAALWLARRTPVLESRAPTGETRLARRVFAAVMVLALLVTVSRVLLASWTPVFRGDEALFWARRAKLWFAAEGFGGVYARTLAEKDLQNAGYPFLNPLLQLWAFDVEGRITHVVNRLPIQMESFALVLCAGSALRRIAGCWLGGVLALVLVSADAAYLGVRHADSDVLVALGALVALDALLRASEDGRRAWLALAGLGAAGLLWAKNEGLLVLACFLVAYVILRRGELRRILRPSRAHLAWLPALCVLALTQTHNRVFQVGGSHHPSVRTIERLTSNLDQALPEVTKAFASAFCDPSVSYIPAVFLLLAALGAYRGAMSVTSSAIVLVLLGFLCVYLGSPVELPKLLDHSLKRILFQLVPIQLLCIGAVASHHLRRSAPARRPGT